jgi:hydrogenase-4 component F
MLIQHNYKRLFAYSSIEHMGLVMIGFGIGGVAGTFGALFHLLNHALAKALAFFTAGNIHRRFNTVEIDGVKGLAKAQPVTAVALVVAGCALVGLPPFSPFFSELLIVLSVATQDFASDTIHAGRFITVTISDEVRSLGTVSLLMLFALIAFGGFMYRIGAMVWGEAPEGSIQPERWTPGYVSLIAMIVALIGLGFALPGPLKLLLNQAVKVVLAR